VENSIEKELNVRLKAAMKAKDKDALEVIRAIRTKVGEKRTTKGFSGEVDDKLYLSVIQAYVKSMTKAKAEYDKAGERGAALASKLGYEINYLSEFMPQKLSEPATEALVREAIAACGATSKRQLGQVMGGVMKNHREEVDAGLVRAIAERLLGTENAG